MSQGVGIAAEIHSWLISACGSYWRLKDRVLENRDITTIMVYQYQAMVISALLYGCETWTPYRRGILVAKWKDRRTNISILKEANMISMGSMIASQLRRVGHIVRMDNTRLPKQLLYGEVTARGRSQGDQCKRYKDWLKTNLKKCGIDTGHWENIALDRTK